MIAGVARAAHVDDHKLSVEASYFDGLRDVHRKTPFTAFEELIDNARNAGAHEVSIAYGDVHGVEVIRVWDNGPGIEKGLEGMKTALALGRTPDAADSGVADRNGMYGTGIKSGCAALADDAIIISQDKSGTRVLALFSKTMHATDMLKWFEVPSCVVGDDAPDTIRTMALILKHIPHVDEAGLMAEFDKFQDDSGLAIILFNLADTFERGDMLHKGDVIDKARKGKEDTDPRDVSLRESLRWTYCRSSVFNKECTHQIEMHLNGELIEPLVLDENTGALHAAVTRRINTRESTPAIQDLWRSWRIRK
jgi:hypothetical protein